MLRFHYWPSNLTQNFLQRNTVASAINLHVDVSLIKRLPSSRFTFLVTNWTHPPRWCMGSPYSMCHVTRTWLPALSSGSCRCGPIPYSFPPTRHTILTVLPQNSLHSVPLSLTSQPIVGSWPHSHLLLPSLCPSNIPSHTIYFQNYILKNHIIQVPCSLISLRSLLLPGLNLVGQPGWHCPSLFGPCSLWPALPYS